MRIVHLVTSRQRALRTAERQRLDETTKILSVFCVWYISDFVRSKHRGGLHWCSDMVKLCLVPFLCLLILSKQKIDNPGSKQKHEKWFAVHISMCMTRQTTQGQTKSDLDSPKNMLHVILWQRKTNTKTPRMEMINNSTEKKKDETKACQRTLQANY